MSSKGVFVLITALAGVGFLLYCQKQVLIKERQRSNKLEVLKLLNWIYKRLHEEKNMEIYSSLAALEQTFIMPGKGDDFDHYTEEDNQGRADLKEYLYVIDLCGKLLRNGLINRCGALSLLSTRWEDIKANTDLCEYFHEPGCPYENLIWMLEEHI